MNVQRFLHTIDGISTWVGKAAAWLIIVLMTGRLRRSLQALHPERADGVDFRRRQHAVRHAVHAVRRLHAGAERACARRLSLQLDAAAHAGVARPRLVHCVFHSRHRRADLRRMSTMPAISWRIAEHSNVTANGPPVYHFKTRHPDRRRAGDAAGHRRDRALRRLSARPASGRAGCRTSPKSTSSRSSSRTANTSTRSRARSRSSARTRSTRSRASAAWAGI